MVTARTQGSDIVEAFRLGANDYVTKPIDFPVALARIGTHLAHKRAVEHLRESEERYALAVQGANDGLWDWNLDDRTRSTGPRAGRRCSGYEESEIGTSPRRVVLARPSATTSSGVKDGARRRISRGASGHYESEHRILHRNGTFRWVLCRGAAIRDGAGIATRLAGSLTDITDAKVSDVLTGSAEPPAVRRSAGSRDQAHGAASRTTSSRCSCSGSIGSSRSTTAWDR